MVLHLLKAQRAVGGAVPGAALAETGASAHLALRGVGSDPSRA